MYLLRKTWNLLRHVVCSGGNQLFLILTFPILLCTVAWESVNIIIGCHDYKFRVYLLIDKLESNCTGYKNKKHV